MFGSTAFGNEPQFYIDKQEDIIFEEPVKWGKTEIIGIPCDWEKVDPLGRYRMQERLAESKLIQGIFTNNLSLVRQGVEEGARITQRIDVVTADTTDSVKCFFVPEAKKYARAEIVDYLRRAFNDQRLVEYKSALRKGFRPEQHVIYGDSSEVETIMMFDGLQPLKVEEDEMNMLETPIRFGNTEIMGFLRYSGINTGMCEVLVRGILTNNLDMVKFAVNFGGMSVIRTIPVVTSEKIQINFNPVVEAKSMGDREMVSYLREVKNEEIQSFCDNYR